MLKSLLAALTALALTLPGAALAQSKVTKMVVAFPPGGPADIVARLVADPMSKDLGHSVIVENKPGGNTLIAAEMVARSPADGSVIFFAGMSTLVINPHIYDKLPYDPVADFTPISLVFSAPTVLVVHPSNPANDAAALAAATKAAAQPFSIASAGIGGTTHIAQELYVHATGAKTLHVPYKGAAPAIQDLLANQIGGFFGDLPGVVGHVRGGKLKAVAVLSKSAHPQLPGIKSMSEQGIAGVEMENWYSLVAPAKTPADVIAKLNKAVHAALADPAAKAKLEELGAATLASTPEAVAKLRSDDSTRLGTIIKAKGIKAE